LKQKGTGIRFLCPRQHIFASAHPLRMFRHFPASATVYQNELLLPEAKPSGSKFVENRKNPTTPHEEKSCQHSFFPVQYHYFFATMR
jgi:hypothetical protein